MAWSETFPRAVPFLLPSPFSSAYRGLSSQQCLQRTGQGAYCHFKASLLSEAEDAHLGRIQTSPSLQWLLCILGILNTPSIPDFTWLKLRADMTQSVQGWLEKWQERVEWAQAYPEAVCIYPQGKRLRVSLQQGARPAEWLQWPRREF